MAVIESKGNGFSLFNGVKLPSLPEYDKEKYPYALVTVEGENTYFLARIEATNVNAAGNVMALNAHVTNGILLMFLLVGGVWNAYVPNGIFQASPIWSNYDIISPTTDNSTFLAASEPISLDGMNVIEWDGDSEGLETAAASASTYLVSRATDVDIEQDVVFMRLAGNLDIPTVAIVKLQDAGDFYGNTMVRVVKTASESYQTTGVYFTQIGTVSRPRLFAYYPIEEPEQPEIDRGTLFLLYKMFSPVVFHAITGKWFWWE